MTLEQFKPGKPWLTCMMLAGLIFVSAPCRAEENHCAWLNQATAAGFLNGPVALDLETGPDDRSICVFTTLKTAKAPATLRIVVQPLKDASNAVASHESLCASAPTALRGIGNEAVSCSADAGSSRGVQVIGRVRDRLFIVTVSLGITQDAAINRKLLDQKTRDVAEQVAGALF